MKDYMCPIDCKDRSGICHGSCERYAAKRAEREAELAARRKDKEFDFYLRDKQAKIERIQRAHKR